MDQPDPAALADVQRRCGRQLTGAFAFGDSPALADELLAFVARGTKRATAASLAEQEAEDEPFPAAGQHWALLDGHGEPRFVMETTQVRIGRLDSVDPAFAWDEGEYDRTYEDWLEGHRRFFARMGAENPDAQQTVFERFRIVWPDEDEPVWLADGVRQIDIGDRGWAADLLEQRHGPDRSQAPDRFGPASLPAIIAERGGRPAGLLTFRPWPDATADIVTVDAFADTMTVDVTERDQDIEAALLDGFAELARREGWTATRHR